MKLLRCAAILAGLSAFQARTTAQVPQLLSHQGRIVVAGTNFDGTGEFKFALVDGAGTNTFWSNDGNSLSGSEPVAAVALTVTKGLYTVLLGDAALSNMTAIAPTVFTNGDVRLRVWFNDGIHGSQQLVPDQRVAAVGYAMMAENVSDGAITGPKIATGAVGSAQLAFNAVQAGHLGSGVVTSVHIADGAITSSLLASGSVTSAQIATGAVTTTGIADGAVNSAQLASNAVQSYHLAAGVVSTVQIAEGAITSSLLASGSVTSAQIASGAVNADSIAGGAVGNAQLAAQAVQSGNIATGAVSSVHIQNGAVNSAQLASNAVQSFHIATGAVTAVQIAAGAVGSGQLASNAVRSFHISTGAVTTVHIAAGAITSALIASGAVMSANIAAGAVGSAQLGANAVHASNLASGAVTSAQLAKPPQSGNIPLGSLTIDFVPFDFSVLFNPVFATTPIVTLGLETSSLTLGTGSKLFVKSKSSSSFTGTCVLPNPDSVRVQTNATAGKYCSLAVVNGRPASAYQDIAVGGAAKLKYVRATDASGATWGTTPMTVDAVTNVGAYASLAIVNGNPAISYYDDTPSNDLKYVRATDASGDTWGSPVRVDTNGTVGLSTSLAVVSGNPAIAYFDSTNGRLKYVRATDMDGTAWSAPVTADTIGTGIIPNNFSLATVNGNPAISYHDVANGRVKYVRATDSTGTAWGTPVILETIGTIGPYVSSLLVVNGQPAIAYYDGTNKVLKYARATDANGTAWATATIVDSAGDVGQFCSLTLVNGNPAISYTDNSTVKSLKYVRSTDANGDSWGTPVSVDTIPSSSPNTSLRIVNGRPAIAYYDSNKGLKFIRPNPSSFSINWIALEP